MSALPYRDASPADHPALEDAWAAYVEARIPDIAEALMRGVEETIPDPVWSAWARRRQAWWDALCHRCNPSAQLDDYTEPEPVWRSSEGPRAALVAAIETFLASLPVREAEAFAHCDIVRAEILDRTTWEVAELERRWEPRHGRDE